MSLIDPLSCGFAKVAVYEFLVSDSHKLRNTSVLNISTVYHEHFEQFKTLFSKFEHVDYEVYKRYFTKIKDVITVLSKNSSKKKIDVLNTFSIHNWNHLSEKSKEAHSLMMCKGCLNNENYRIPLSYFPISKNFKSGKRKAEEFGLYKPSKVRIAEAAKEDIKQLNKDCNIPQRIKRIHNTIN